MKSGKRSRRSGSDWELTVVAADPPPPPAASGEVEAALALSGTVGDGQARLLLPAGGNRARAAVVFAEFEGELDAADAAKIARSLIYFQGIFGEEARVRVVQMREIPLPWGRTAWVGLLRLQGPVLTPERAIAYFKRVFRSLSVEPIRIAVEIWG
ncbi:MAG: hypothetical protein J7452_12505 [Thermoflexus sp.]|nr:hypothetical protein [Thermoflexus sp.]